VSANWFDCGELPHQPVPEGDAWMLERLKSTSSEPFPCLEIDCQSRLETDILQRWSNRPLHGSGVIGLRRLEGDDLHGERYQRQYYIGRLGGHDLALARVVWDRVDRRARILEMHTLVQGLQGILLTLIVFELQRQSAGEQLTLVIDVLAHATNLHATLEELGFRPTVYYPGLVATEQERSDAVQYTRLLNCKFEDSLRCLPKIDWQQAREIVGQVRQLHAGR